MPSSQRAKAPVQAFPIWQTRGIALSAKRCFVIMPLGDAGIRRLYDRHVSSVLAGLGLEALHAGQRHGQVITEDIWIALNEARVVLAELTGTNPNVMYELGVAHTLGKPVILLTSDRVTKIPFDVRALRHVIYDRSAAGVRAMKVALRNELEFVLDEFPLGHALIAAIESTAKEWSAGYREYSLCCSVDDLNWLRAHGDAQLLTDRAISFCAASACYHGSAENMRFWGRVCDQRVPAAQDLVFMLFAEHARTRVRAAHLLAQMSPATHAQVLPRLLEHHAPEHFVTAITAGNVLPMVARDFEALRLRPQYRDALLYELPFVKW